MKKLIIHAFSLLMAACLVFGAPPCQVLAEGEKTEEEGENGNPDENGDEGEGNGENPEEGDGTDSGESGEDGISVDDVHYITAQDWPDAPEVGAEGAIVIDAVTGAVLYEKNADRNFFPASITKLLTGLLAAEQCSMNEYVTYSYTAIHSVPNGYAHIAALEGEQMTVEDCMYALLLPSANDAANALAEHISGSIEAFADLMNQRAAELGAKHTHFVNPSGIHSEDHVTTPYDMAMIMRGCIGNEKFMQVDTALTHVIEPTNKQPEKRPMATLHRMLPTHKAEYYEYAVGGKTGYTTPAGNTLVTYAEKGDLRLICVVMHSSNTTYEDTEALLEYGFNNFKMYQASQVDNRYTLESYGFFEGNLTRERTASIEFDDEGWVILPQNASFFDTDPELNYVDETLNEENVFADLTYYYQGMEVGQAKLKLVTVNKGLFDFDTHSASDADSNSGSPLSEIKEAVSDSDNKKPVILVNIRYVAGGVLAVLAVVFAVLAVRRHKQRMDPTPGFLKLPGSKKRNIKFKANRKMKF